MAKIFISYAREDSAIAQRTAQELIRRQHDVFLDQQSLRPGAHWQEDIKNHLQDADVFLALVTEHSDESYYFHVEVTTAIAYVAHSNKDKLILPVVVGKATIENSELGAFQAVFGGTEDFDLVVNEIDNAISTFEGYRLAKQELEQLRAAALEQKSTDYVKDTLDDLSARERAMTRLAFRWHLAGYASLVVCIVAVLLTWWTAERTGYTSSDVIRLVDHLA